MQSHLIIIQRNDNEKEHLLVCFNSRKNEKVDNGVNLIHQSRIIEESRDAE